MTTQQRPIAALILAAGESTRMGRLKQLIDWGGTTLLAWQVEQMRLAGADDVVVVLGHEAEAIARRIAGAPCRIAVNPGYREGRATSLRRGAEALADGTAAVLVLSVDQPRPAWLSRRLIDRWQRGDALVVSPRFAGGYGHPILLDGSLLAELRTVEEATLGLRAVIDRHLDRAVSIDVENVAVDVDLNTPEAYEAACRAFEAGDWNQPVT